jgi:class 3 adenylate cyclase
MTESASPTEIPASERLLAGRAAHARRDWQVAFESLSEADREGELAGADLELLAEASWFTAHADLETEYKERAFKAYSAAGDRLRAAYVALDVAHGYGFRGKTSIASAWMQRGARLLEGMEEGYAHGYLALLRSDVAKAAGDIDTALALAEQGVAIADHASNPDLHASALTALGTLKIATGDPTGGFALMEEASIAAVNGELSPITTGVTCCTMIAACRDLTDYRRASEWTEATDRYCERQSVAGFPGVCRIHRAEIAAVGGAWSRAEEEIQRATDELAGFNATPPLADGYYALGEIRRLKGDLHGAEAALRQAHALGRVPQPALALIRLAEGNIRAAVAGIKAALKETTWDQFARARLLPAQVEIAIASADHVLAREAAEELTRIIDTYSSPALEAGRHQAWGRVLMAEGDLDGAVRELRAAVGRWREVASPYEIARTRGLLSKALRAMDDMDGADLELAAARDEYARLGAALDLAAVDQEIQAAAERRAGPSTARKTFMFTDIVGSTNLAETLGNQAWERLLTWHDDLLRGLVGARGGEVVQSTGDGFFVAFDTAGQALACARAIQRTLAEQRDDARSGLSVRIGLHTAEANRRGSDYSGVGVHTAARVAALAQAREILATAETLADAGDPAAETASEAVLRGLTMPVRLAAVGWD